MVWDGQASNVGASSRAQQATPKPARSAPSSTMGCRGVGSSSKVLDENQKICIKHTPQEVVCYKGHHHDGVKAFKATSSAKLAFQFRKTGNHGALIALFASIHERLLCSDIERQALILS
jgi:hypothetical protein